MSDECVAPPECPPRSQTGGVAWWPFFANLAGWAGLVAATVYLLGGPQATTVPLENPAYPVLLLAAVTLTAFGPLMALFVWLVAWSAAAPECRSGLLTTALVRGAGATAAGVLVWWAALIIVDSIRLGALG
ncbi:MAG: hypothetical protein KGZ40_03755 [Clostridiales bacterium]|nr:hypothetical protein [Clostridiales bacterium]